MADTGNPEWDWRLGGQSVVTGATVYAADVTLPGMLWAKALRSPVPHARIVSIDTSRARALPGVHAVLTGLDLPDVRVGRSMRDMPVLARDKVRFIGEKVAAVAADSPDVAEDALALIDVVYEELPAVFDPIEAMQPGAPLVHDPALVRAWATPKQQVADYPNSVSNPIWGASEQEMEQAFARCLHVFEHTFRTPVQHQGYIEPHACLVSASAGPTPIEGTLAGNHDVPTGPVSIVNPVVSRNAPSITASIVEHEVHSMAAAPSGHSMAAAPSGIWASNKAPFLLLDYLRLGLGLQREDVEIHMLPLGGDFGGKGSFMDVPLTYFLSRASGRPVKMVMTYTEELMAGNPRHSAVVTVKSGFDERGKLLARWTKAVYNSGGYAAFKPAPDVTLPRVHVGGLGAYEIPISRVEGHMVYTNTVPCGHMREPGGAQPIHAIECHMDLCARAMGIDPLELRVTNAPSRPAGPGVEGTLGGAPPSPQPSPKRGEGAIASAQPSPTEGEEVIASLPVGEAGGVIASPLAGEAGPQSGAGEGAHLRGAFTSAPGGRSMADAPNGPAAALKVAAEAIGWDEPKPDGVGRGIAFVDVFNSPADAYTTRLVARRDGRFVLQTPIIEQGSGMLTAFRLMVADALGVAPESVEIAQTMEGIEHDRGVGGSRVTRVVGKMIGILGGRTQTRLVQLVAAEFGCEPSAVLAAPSGFRMPDGRVLSTAEAASLATEDVAEQIRYETADADVVDAYAAVAAEARVDRETGQVQVNRVAIALEVGRVINPTMHQGQIDGGIIQGMGYALMEGLAMEDGRVVMANLNDYKLPGVADIPSLTTIKLEPDLSLGITPIGEGPNCAISAAIVNAIVDVVGHQVEIPISPERIAGTGPLSPTLPASGEE